MGIDNQLVVFCYITNLYEAEFLRSFFDYFLGVVNSDACCWELFCFPPDFVHAPPQTYTLIRSQYGK